MVLSFPKPLSKMELNELFIEALGKSVQWHSGINTFPLECDIGTVTISKFRVYLYTVTRQHGGRPQDEYKIQVILPGQKSHTKMSLDASNGRYPILGGLSRDFGAFVFWDASLYSGFSYSRNMQVKEKTLAESLSAKISLQERWLRQSASREKEHILACQPRNLESCLDMRLLGVFSD